MGRIVCRPILPSPPRKSGSTFRRLRPPTIFSRPWGSCAETSCDKRAISAGIDGVARAMGGHRAFAPGPGSSTRRQSSQAGYAGSIPVARSDHEAAGQDACPACGLAVASWGGRTHHMRRPHAGWLISNSVELAQLEYPIGVELAEGRDVGDIRVEAEVAIRVVP